MFNSFFKTSLAPLALRLALGLIFIYHGGLKITRDFGTSWDTALPEVVQAMVAWGELFCALALLIGLGSRYAAVGICIIMLGALAMVTGQQGFVRVDLAPGLHGFNFLATGYEYNLAIVAMCFTLVCLGSGVVSVDYLLTREKKIALKPSGGVILGH